MSKNFYYFLAAAVALLVIGSCITDTSKAQRGPSCGTPEQYAKLLKRAGESPVFMGLSRQGALVEITLNPKTGSWTVFAHLPDGRICMFDAGEGGVTAAPKPPKAKGDPA